MTHKTGILFWNPATDSFVFNDTQSSWYKLKLHLTDMFVIVRG